MTRETRTVVGKIDALVAALSSPLSDEMEDDGWNSESLRVATDRLEAFRAQIELLGDLPPRSEWPLNLVRGMDAWGVNQGSLLHDIAQFESYLRTEA